MRRLWKSGLALSWALGGAVVGGGVAAAQPPTVPGPPTSMPPGTLPGAGTAGTGQPGMAPLPGSDTPSPLDPLKNQSPEQRGASAIDQVPTPTVPTRPWPRATQPDGGAPPADGGATDEPQPAPESSRPMGSLPEDHLFEGSRRAPARSVTPDAINPLKDDQAPAH